MCDLEKPTKGLIEFYIDQFNNEEENKETVLRHVFKNYNSKEDIMTQSFLLNSLYGTHVDCSSLSEISEYIFKRGIVNKIITSATKDYSVKGDVVNEIA